MTSVASRNPYLCSQSRLTLLLLSFALELELLDQLGFCELPPLLLLCPLLLTLQIRRLPVVVVRVSVRVRECVRGVSPRVRVRACVWLSQTSRIQT